MAIRNLRFEDDEILRKKSKPVKEINANIIELLDDMGETMKKAMGCGLAAVQVGSLKRIFIIDIGEGLIEFINPEIVETSGEILEEEGCLSIPGRTGSVLRPECVVIKATDRGGEEFVTEAEGILAKAICHESDHLDGILYIDKAIEMYDNDDNDEDDNLE